MSTFLTLFYEFFKVGLFSVGGGLATIPFLEEMAKKYPWFTVSELSDMIAVAESTPGPIGVNMATFAGYRAGMMEGGILSGILGGIVATLGIVAPALIVICIISGFLEKFKTNKYVERAFYGIRPAVSGLIVGAMSGVFLSAVAVFDEVGKLASLDFVSLAIFAVITAVYAKFNKAHPIWFIAAGAVIGIVLGL